jgi:type II secretory pathway pseudopilin PulG
MSEGARVESIESLQRMHVALVKFSEAIAIALADAEGELSRTQVWLETEQLSHWQGEIRKRHDTLERAKEAVRMKKLFKDSSGRTPSAVEEEKAARLAQQRLEEAQRKLEATKKYTKVLQREIQNYKGGVQRLATSLADGVPTALQTLSSYSEQLRRYVGYGPAAATSEASAPGDAAGATAGSTHGSMARPADERPSEPEPTEASPSDEAAPADIDGKEDRDGRV